MKRWIVLLTVVGILGLFLAFVSLSRDWHHYVWAGYMPGYLNRLAGYVNVFYIDYNVYPEKLSDLLPPLDLRACLKSRVRA